MALRALPVEGLSLPLSHSPPADGPKGPAATDSRALAHALLAKAQEATDPATVRALVDAARALLAERGIDGGPTR
jgi:hypothetical protein